MSNIDEIVVGQSNQDFLSKMEEELNKVKEQEQEEEKKPLEERVKSKNWKTRKNAYTEIFNILKVAESRTDKIFLDYVNLYPVMIDDPHASAQETALEVVKILLENYEFASNLVPDLFKVILEKCYTSSRAVLKSKAKEMLVLSLEVSNESIGVIEIIKSGLENKNPKFQQASVNILTHLISLFGSFKIEYRSLITLVEKLSESTSPQMRSEVLDFYKELYKWIKDAIKPYVNRLKDTHQKDLEKAFDEIKAKNGQIPQVTKFLKCDKNQQNDPSTNDEIKNKMLLLQEEENIFKNTEAVELFQGKFNEAWAEDIISKDRKWSEKKEMLDNFITASNVMKINNSSKSHVIVSFQKLLKDNNINVVNAVILAINNMAKGLRKDFTEAKEFLMPLIDKLKEKREKLVQDVFVCLDSLMTHCINIEEVIEDLRSFISSASNTIQSKERFCVFLEKVILKTYIQVLRKVGKSLGEIMFKLSDDASPDVRNAALTTIGVIKFRIGDMPISKILNELCDIKKKKVDEASKNVTVDPIYDKDDSKDNKKKNIGGNKNLLNNNNVVTGNNFNNKKFGNENVLSTDNDIEMKDCSEVDVVVMKKPNKNNNLQQKINPPQEVINDIEMNPVVNNNFF
jgi:cytoskeleton-associated protein 5